MADNRIGATKKTRDCLPLAERPDNGGLSNWLETLMFSARLPKATKLYFPVSLALGILDNITSLTYRGWVYFRRTLAMGVLQNMTFDKVAKIVKLEKVVVLSENAQMRILKPLAELYRPCRKYR